MIKRIAPLVLLVLLFMFFISWIVIGKTDKKERTASEIYNSLQNDCSKDETACIKPLLKRLTEQYGPEKSLEILSLMQKENKVAASLPGHSLAHYVGEQTARTFGLNLESYLLCPESGQFGGCDHGFLEYAVLQENAFSKTEEEICSRLKEGKPDSDLAVFYCYHGIGHGLFMIKGEKIKPALVTCDQIKQNKDIEACWSGVFNAAFATHVSDSLDLSSPKSVMEICTSLEKKYHKQCISNIGLLLIESSGNSIERASQSCLSLPFEEKAVCAGSLGSFTTTAAVNRSESPEVISRAAKICSSLHDSIKSSCASGALQRLMFDTTTAQITNKASEFCEEIEGALKKDCYKEIGKYISIHMHNSEQKKIFCNKLPADYIPDCYLGAGL